MGNIVQQCRVLCVFGAAAIIATAVLLLLLLPLWW